MVLEPPLNLPASGLQKNISAESGGIGLPWRHMKFACGENPKRIYGMSRMDTAWELRLANHCVQPLPHKADALNDRKIFAAATKVKEEQEEFCSSLDKDPSSIPRDKKFPEAPLDIEALVDVLLGKVKVNVHCYEVGDSC
jgi:hypothetical protein